MEHIELFFKSVFIDNMVFATFLGMCSYLAVSKKVSTAIGLGAAVTFVLAITVPLNWLLDQYILQDGALAWLHPSLVDYDLSFLSFIMFIATIATMVQLVEIIVEKFSDTYLTLPFTPEFEITPIPSLIPSFMPLFIVM